MVQVKPPSREAKIIREMRDQRGHTFAQMLSSIGLSHSAYRRMIHNGRLHEVITEYQQVPLETPKPLKPPLRERLAETYALKMLNRSHLPAVGSTLRNGEQVVKVIRHTGNDSVMVEWTDENGLKRRAEWTTRANPRCTYLGQWERING